MASFSGGGTLGFSNVTLKSGSQVPDTTALTSGGALYNERGPLTIETDVRICGNTVTPRCGGDAVTPPESCPVSETCL